MLASTHALLDGGVDCAGTFPPAGLTLADALAESARARQSATGELADSRRRFFRSSGSCAFRGPADDIRHFDR
jgi:hypothetical protein